MDHGLHGRENVWIGIDRVGVLVIIADQLSDIAEPLVCYRLCLHRFLAECAQTVLAFSPKDQ